MYYNNIHVLTIILHQLL